MLPRKTLGFGTTALLLLSGLAIFVPTASADHCEPVEGDTSEGSIGVPDPETGDGCMGVWGSIDGGYGTTYRCTYSSSGGATPYSCKGVGRDSNGQQCVAEWKDDVAHGNWRDSGDVITSITCV